MKAHLDISGKLTQSYLALCETRRVAELSKLAGFVSEDTSEIFTTKEYGMGHLAIYGGGVVYFKKCVPKKIELAPTQVKCWLFKL